MTFEQQLIITLIDKGAIAALLVIAGYFLNWSLEKIKRQQELENELTKLRDTRRLDCLDAQLSKYYWPLFIRLRLNDVWQGVLKYRKEDADARGKIQENFIHPNNEKILEIIESNIHLAECDPDAFKALCEYTGFVADSKVAKNAGDIDIDKGLELCNKLLSLVEKKANTLQKEYDEALRSVKMA